MLLTVSFVLLNGNGSFSSRSLNRFFLRCVGVDKTMLFYYGFSIFGFVRREQTGDVSKWSELTHCFPLLHGTFPFSLSSGIPVQGVLAGEL